jgi:hypothetical protein
MQQGRDYYIEKGYYVFTEYYLAQRGYCCNSGCRHCPYRKKEIKPIGAELESAQSEESYKINKDEDKNLKK